MSVTMARPSPAPGPELSRRGAAAQHFLLPLGRDASPVVGHAHGHHVGLDASRDRDAHFGVARGILDEIAKRLGEVLGVDARGVNSGIFQADTGTLGNLPA